MSRWMRSLVAGAVAATALGVAAPAHATVSHTFANGTLTVTADVAERISIDCHNGMVRLRLNLPDTAVRCADVTLLDITGSAANDEINLRSVTQTTFPGLTLATKITVRGGSGDDAIQGGPLKESFLGGPGNDTIHAGTGNDTIDGNSGNDTITGDANGDQIYASAGIDTISGGLGNDWIRNLGAAGNDIVFGNDGDDNFVWDAAAGTAGATINGGPGFDMVRVTSTAAGAEWNVRPSLDATGMYLTTTIATVPAIPVFESEKAILTLGAGDDTVRVTMTAGFAVQAEAAAGTDRLNVTVPGGVFVDDGDTIVSTGLQAVQYTNFESKKIHA